MKLKLCYLCGLALFAANVARAQGTFQFDQQSTTETNPAETAVLSQDQPLGQSFTPTLSEVGFVQFYLGEFGGSGALFVNLRSDSITGNLLGSTDLMSFNSSYQDAATFYFRVPISVNPGATYYFQPIAQTGSCFIHIGPAYDGGTAFANGTALDGSGGSFNQDLWFREGVVVPEPSSAALLLTGAGIFIGCRFRKRSKS